MGQMVLLLIKWPWLSSPKDGMSSISPVIHFLCVSVRPIIFVFLLFILLLFFFFVNLHISVHLPSPSHLLDLLVNYHSYVFGKSPAYIQ